MIKVVITGPPSNGFYPYRIDWRQIIGASPAPLLDAAYKLKQLGLMDTTVVALYEQNQSQWSRRMTIGEGAWQIVESMFPQERPARRDRHPTDEELAELELIGEEFARSLNERIARPAVQPLPPHKSPKRQAGTGLPIPKRGSLTRSRQKRRRAKSGGRRESSSRR